MGKSWLKTLERAVTQPIKDVNTRNSDRVKEVKDLATNFGMEYNDDRIAILFNGE